MNTKKKGTRIIWQFAVPIMVCLQAISSIAVLAQPPSKEVDPEVRRCLEKIANLYDVAAAQLADPVAPEKTIYDGAIRGALAALDPFSAFFQAQQQGSHQGFGAILSVQPGHVTILQSLPGSSFARSGLGTGDQIIRINDHQVQSLGLRELAELLQQASPGPVRLSVLQSGKTVPQDLELDPTEIPTPTVDKNFLLEPDVAYLHLARMEETTPGEMKVVLQGWQKKNLRGLILDLRDNPGGLLDATVAVAGMFLQKGQAVVSLQGRSVPEREYVVESSPLVPDLPLVVVVNGNTASAAEILAAALQEHDRAWVIGETTFGKGVAESVMPLSQGTVLALTTARYFTPTGRSVQRPLPGTALAGMFRERKMTFFTDGGRPLFEGGGVQPDQNASSWQLDHWANFLQESTAFTSFARLYVEQHGKADEAFEVNDRVVDEFRIFLRGAGVQVPTQSWESSLPFIKIRIKTELSNLTFGSFRGEEVDLRGDPLVQSSIAALSQAQKLIQRQDYRRRQEIVAGPFTKDSAGRPKSN